MLKNSLNVVLDAFWGSCGKGKVCDYLAHKHSVTDLVSGNMPNAGHTVVRDGRVRIAKVLPSAGFFNHNARLWMSASSGFTVERFNEEVDWLQPGQILKLHERAFTVSDEHKRFEAASLSRVSSTMQGSAAAMVDKIMRVSNKTIRDLPFQQSSYITKANDWRSALLQNVLKGTALYEVAQGWGLSIDHGTDYPHCTSRNCSTNRALDDAAVPPQLVGDVIAVIRPYPIRVGNTADGYSGDWMPDCSEVSWEHVRRVSGLNENLEEKERTTVTKRIRRVSTFSYELLKDCVRHNGVTGIFLNFAQYIDSSCAGKRGKMRDAPKAVRVFANSIEMATHTPVIGYGTGADTFDVLD